MIESYQSMLKTKSKEDQTHNIHNWYIYTQPYFHRIIYIFMQGILREKTSLTEKEKEYETLKNLQENIEEQLR